jgi:hypothetical protein
VPDLPVRPHTRGELCQRLREGVACEVVSAVAEMTAIMLRGWLCFDAFSVRASPYNDGWSVFEPLPVVTEDQPKGESA